MRKENLIIRTVFAASLLGGATACDRMGVPIEQARQESNGVLTTDPLVENLTASPTPFLPETPTVYIALATPTSLTTPIPTPSETASPTPTKEGSPFLINGVEFNQELEIFMSFPFNIKTSYIPIFYPDGLSGAEIQKLFNEDRPGYHRGLTDTDGRNIILELHSGYSAITKHKDEAEGLRHFIQGDSDSTILSPDYATAQLNKLLGQSVAVSQNGNQTSFVIAAAVIIPHEQKPLFDENIKGAFDTAIAVGGGPDKSDFKIFKEQAGLIIAFCGWGPSLAPEQNRYIWSEIIFGLLPSQ